MQGLRISYRVVELLTYTSFSTFSFALFNIAVYFLAAGQSFFLLILLFLFVRQWTDA
jgi:hypothetical protein